MTISSSVQRIVTTGDNIVGIWRPTFVEAKDQLYVFGGGGGPADSGMTILDLGTMKWKTIQAVKGVAPCKRYGHTATLWNNYIVVFGGCDEEREFLNDLHLFDIEKNTWTQPEQGGSIPKQYLHDSCVYNDKLFVYGGFAKTTEDTYVVDQIKVLDLQTFAWSTYSGVPPRYNHSTTLVGHKMYIFGGKDEVGNTVSDLFVADLTSPPFTPELLSKGSEMTLLKSQHFCDIACGQLLILGRYVAAESDQESKFGLWMLDLDSLTWERQGCGTSFETGVWNYFKVFPRSEIQKSEQMLSLNNLVFLGNADQERAPGYDHFRDVMIIDGETLGLSN